MEFVSESGMVLSPSDEKNAPGADGNSPSLAVVAGEVVEVNAGYALPVTVSGHVWLESQNDGIRSSGEDPVNAVTVSLFEVDPDTGARTLVATQTTGEHGTFLFEQLPALDYELAFDMNSLPENTSPVVQFVGTDSTIDSDVDEEGRTTILRTEPGEDYSNIDMGLELPIGDPPSALAFTGSWAGRTVSLATLLLMLGWLLVLSERRSRRTPLG